MPTTVRVDDPVKGELDRLQGELLAETGERVSHSELLARLLRYARRHQADFLHHSGEPRRPTRQDLDRWRARLPDVRVRYKARDLDEALYSERP